MMTQSSLGGGGETDSTEYVVPSKNCPWQREVHSGASSAQGPGCAVAGDGDGADTVGVTLQEASAGVMNASKTTASLMRFTLARLPSRLK